jgi:hypothetical protein
MDNPTTSKPTRIPDHLQTWITARNRYRLSHAHVRMARELGMNPKKLGKLDNADQEPWKLPLPAFIESLTRSALARIVPTWCIRLRSAPAFWNGRRPPDAKQNGCGARQHHERVSVL